MSHGCGRCACLGVLLCIFYIFNFQSSILQLFDVSWLGLSLPLFLSSDRHTTSGAQHSASRVSPECPHLLHSAVFLRTSSPAHTEGRSRYVTGLTLTATFFLVREGHRVLVAPRWPQIRLEAPGLRHHDSLTVLLCFSESEEVYAW